MPALRINVTDEKAHSMIAKTIGGCMQKIDDGAANWKLADEVAALGARVEKFEWDGNIFAALVKLAELQKAGNVEAVLFLVYSYGTAALFEALRRMQMMGLELPRIDALIIAVGVNRAAWAQIWDDCWTIDTFSSIRWARAINTVYRFAVPGRFAVLPECCPLRGANVIDWNVTAGDQGPTADFVNINIFWDANPQQNLPAPDHVNIFKFPITRETILKTALKLIEAERSAA